MLKKTFEKLGLSPMAHEVYTQLLEKGPCSARQISERINIPRTSVYDHLSILINKGLVTEIRSDNKRLFNVDDPKNLPKLIEESIQSLKDERDHVSHILPTLLKQSSSIEPKIRLFSGVEGVRHVLNDFKWQQNLDTMSMWPIAEMISLLGRDFFDDLNRRRIKQNISIRGIWPHGKGADIKSHPFMGSGREFLREIREAPKNMHWNMGYWIYGDKVAFISSKKEVFGFTIHSKEFAEVMKVQFESVWNTSKKIKPLKKYTDPWINEVYSKLGKNIPR
jgi:sugar-specific transcriptional regulator TrmB